MDHYLLRVYYCYNLSASIRHEHGLFFDRNPVLSKEACFLLGSVTSLTEKYTETHRELLGPYIICPTEVGGHALWTTHTVDLTFPLASLFACLLRIDCSYQCTCGKSRVLWQSIGFGERWWSTYVRAVDRFRISKYQEVHKHRCKILFKKDLPWF